MNKEEINKIEENFKKYFDIDFLIEVLKNESYEEFKNKNMVAINIRDYSVYSILKNEIKDNDNIKYFELCDYKTDFERYINIKDKKIKEIIELNFFHNGFYGVDLDEKFYLIRELEKIKNKSIEDLSNDYILNNLKHI